MKNQTKLWVTVGIVVAIVIALIAVFPVQKQEEEVIKVGYLAVLSGPAASAWGFYGRDAAEMAVDEINKYGDVKIEIIWGDSAAKPEQGVTEFKKMNDIDKPDVFVVDASGVASAVEPLADTYKKPIIFGAVALIGITNQSEYLFRNFYTCDKSAPLLAEKVYKMGIKRIGILSQNEPYGQSCSEYFRKTFEKLGGEITTEEKFMLSDFEFRTQLMKIDATNPDAIYINGYEKWLLEIVKEMKELGINRTILSEMVIYAPVIREKILNLTNPPDLYITTTKFYTGYEKAAEFQQKFKEKYGKEPPYLAGYIYDTFRIIAKADEMSKKQGIPLREALLKVKINGVSGRLEFDENRETHAEMLFVKVNKDGSLSLE